MADSKAAPADKAKPAAAKGPQGSTIQCAMRIRTEKPNEIEGKHQIIVRTVPNPSGVGTMIKILNVKNGKEEDFAGYRAVFNDYQELEEWKKAGKSPEEIKSKFAAHMQQKVWDELGREVFDNAVATYGGKSYNTTLLAYGATGGGKSYSMVGKGGIIPRCSDELFKYINKRTAEFPGEKYEVSLSMVEVLDEQIYDLLDKDNQAIAQMFKPRMRVKDNKSASGNLMEAFAKALKTRKNLRNPTYDKAKGVQMADARKVSVDSTEMIDLFQKSGDEARSTMPTLANPESSRAHTLFTLYFTRIIGGDKRTTKINLVDLAGAETAAATDGAVGSAVTKLQMKNINQSLNQLNGLLSDLSLGKKVTNAAYTGSKLTRLLQDSIGGNAKGYIIGALAPSGPNNPEKNYTHSKQTLVYVQKAAAIKNDIVEQKDEKNLDLAAEKNTPELVKKMRAEQAKYIEQAAKWEKTAAKTAQEKEEIEKTRLFAEKKMAELEQKLLSMSSHEEELATARAEAAQMKAQAQQEQEMKTKVPYLMRLTEDDMRKPDIFFINEARLRVCRFGSAPPTVDNDQQQHTTYMYANGVNIEGDHCLIERNEKDDTIFITPSAKLAPGASAPASAPPAPAGGALAKVIRNGKVLSGRTELQHNDRVLLGNYNYYRLIVPARVNSAPAVADTRVLTYEGARAEFENSLIDVELLKKTEEAAKIERAAYEKQKLALEKKQKEAEDAARALAAKSAADLQARQKDFDEMLKKAAASTDLERAALAKLKSDVELEKKAKDEAARRDREEAQRQIDLLKLQIKANEAQREVSKRDDDEFQEDSKRVSMDVVCAREYAVALGFSKLFFRPITRFFTDPRGFSRKVLLVECKLADDAVATYELPQAFHARASMMEQAYNDFHDTGRFDIATLNPNPFDLTDSSARWIGLTRAALSWYIDDLGDSPEDSMTLFGYSGISSTQLYFKITGKIVGEKRDEGSDSISPLHANKGKMIDIDVHVVKAMGLPREYSVQPYVEYHFWNDPTLITVKTTPRVGPLAAGGGAPDQNPVFTINHKKTFRVKIDDAFLQHVDYGGPNNKGGIIEFNVWGSPKQKSVKATADSAPTATFDGSAIRFQAQAGVRPPSPPFQALSTPRTPLTELLSLPAGSSGITLDLTKRGSSSDSKSPPGSAAGGRPGSARPVAGRGNSPPQQNFGQNARFNETDIHADGEKESDEKVKPKDVADKEAYDRMAKEQNRALAELMRIHSVLNPAMSSLDPESMTDSGSGSSGFTGGSGETGGTGELDPLTLSEHQGSIAHLAHNVTREVQGLILSNGKFQSLYEAEKKKASNAAFELERMKAQFAEFAALKTQLSEVAALKEALSKAEHAKTIAIKKYTNLMTHQAELQKKIDQLAGAPPPTAATAAKK